MVARSRRYCPPSVERRRCQEEENISELSFRVCLMTGKMYSKFFARSCPWEQGQGGAAMLSHGNGAASALLLSCCDRAAVISLRSLHRNVVRLVPPWIKRLEPTHHKHVLCRTADILSQDRAQRCHRAIPHRLLKPPTKTRQQLCDRLVRRAIDTHILK